MTWICPNCKGQVGTLYIHDVLVSVAVYPDGAELQGDLEWRNHNRAACSCGWSGTAADCAVIEALDESSV